MLKKISCDKFISNGQIRPAIEFHPGLNTVLGSADAKNSIGKSTLLMIIDFVFGGKDYLNKKTKDAVDNIGHHTIKFEFEFDGKSYYFSRSTENPSFVNMCDANYNVLSTIPLDQYNKALANHYGLSNIDITLRDAIGSYFRIYHRETTNEEYPLRAATQQSANDGIVSLMKLFDSYSSIADQEKILDRAKDEESTFNKAKKYNQIKATTSNTEFENNEKEIKRLEEELNQLSTENENGLNELDAVQAQQLAEIKKELSSLKRQKTHLKIQLDALKEDHDESKKTFKHDYDCLREFFPNANFNELEKVENFHVQLSKILKKEYKDSQDAIQRLLDVVNEKIKYYEGLAANIKTAPNVSKAVLLKYAELTKNIEILKEANKNFEKGKELNAIHKKEKETYNTMMSTTSSSIQDRLNAYMKELNDSIYQGTKTSPKLNIIDSNHYEFFVPNDGGTGTQYRGLIIFDLAVLNNTYLPAVVHDSIVLKNIEDYALEKLIELYSKTKKQVFIAFDRDETYSPEMRKILNDTKVIKLSGNGNQLFGKSWNEISEDK